jgi:hypothetical protein
MIPGSKIGPRFVISKPGSSARNLLAAGSETADSSREKPRFGMTIIREFESALLQKPAADSDME